jgi:hypothetical protein
MFKPQAFKCEGVRVAGSSITHTQVVPVAVLLQLIVRGLLVQAEKACSEKALVLGAVLLLGSTVTAVQ